MSGEKVKVAIIGAGGWGAQHARIAAGRPDVDLCAITGRTPAKTRERAEQYGTRFYTEVKEMLRNEKPDLVHICLPNQQHYETTLEVIRHGVPLFVEKPLVFELQQGQHLLEEAERRNLFFAINFNHRYAKPVQLAREAAAAGKLGEIVFVSWRFGGEGSSDHPHANLIETQCHGFDLLEHLCGPIRSVMAEMTDMTGKGYSTLAVSLRFANGAVGSLLGTYDSSYSYPGTHFMEINGTAGRVTIEDTVKKYTYHPAGSEIGEIWKAGYFNDWDREFHRTFDSCYGELIEAFKKGEPPPIHASSGFRALEIAHAVIASFHSGSRVFV
ncbi:Gfo/Idh/MocA family protein [Paenibacillus gansuensis]|uniref:Gfo/Idh/MocA family protein n=1 Tax=Paenibacillus gansuensis TaxID=306542 RepID=A0ABW5PBX2_9BACL